MATAIACCRAAWRASRRATPRCARSAGCNGTLKDVWVLAEDAADVQLPSSRRFHQLAVERGGADLQSRVADNLYWLGRYIERLDNDAAPAAHHRHAGRAGRDRRRAMRSSCACSAA